MNPRAADYRRVHDLLSRLEVLAEVPSFTCPRCGRTSYHPEDARQGYCGACHEFTAVVSGGE